MNISPFLDKADSVASEIGMSGRVSDHDKVAG